MLVNEYISGGRARQHGRQAQAVDQDVDQDRPDETALADVEHGLDEAERRVGDDVPQLGGVMVHQHRHRHVLEAEGERRDRVRQRRIDLQQGAQQHEAVEHLLHHGTGDHDHQAHEDRRPKGASIALFMRFSRHESQRVITQ